MRKISVFLLAFLFLSELHAQPGIGIGTTSPNSSAMLDVVSTSKGFLMPRMTSAQRAAIATPAAGLMVYETTSNTVWVYNGSTWVQLGAAGGPSLWALSPFNINHIYSTNTGSVGIGTNNPFAKLHINAGSVYMQDNRDGADLNPYIMFDIPSVDYKEAGLQWRRNSDTLASIKYVAHPTLANFIQIKASESGTGPSLYITNNGTGIGAPDPQATLHVRKSDAEEMLRLDGLNPMIKFRKYVSLFNYDDVGFLQTVNDDLRIGTFSNNTLGDFIIRTGGSDNMIVDQSGDVGIGSLTNPLTKLHINNGQDAGLSSADNGYIMLGVGTPGSTNLIIDNNEIIVRDGYTGTGNLHLQNDGGDLTIGARTTINRGGEALKLDGDDPAINLYDNGVQKGYLWVNNTAVRLGVLSGNLQLDGSVNVSYQMGIGTTAPLSKLHIPAGSDASLSSHGYFMLGPSSGENIVFDNNEIIARNNGGTATLVLQNNGGSVRIGSAAVPAGYHFAINGKMICEELKIQMSGSWPDYVFGENYKLKSLDELRNFIAQNKHLPNIPAAADVEKNGLEVGDMQKRMMEKIEELTLYVLQLEEKINKLENKK
jgi:hypothetical protein